MYNCVSISSFQVEESFLVILIIIISIPHFMFLALGDSRPKQRCFAVLSNWRKFSISLSNTTLDIKAKAAGLSLHLWISHLLLMHGIFHALGLPTWWPMPHWSNSLVEHDVRPIISRTISLWVALQSHKWAKVLNLKWTMLLSFWEETWPCKIMP